jgi:hypothetical protein
VILFGAWQAIDGSWSWVADGASRLSETETFDGTVLIDHRIETIDGKPQGAVWISVLERPGLALFRVRRRQQRLGDGWVVADKPKWKAIARLHLPGEERIFGGQDFTAANERWQLAADALYVVEIEEMIPARRPGELPVYRASGPPRRVAR